MFGPEKCLSVRPGSFDWGQMTPKEHISEQYIDAIMEVAGSIHPVQHRDVGNGEMTETAYVEVCLWLSSEGMIKLLSAFIATPLKSEYAGLVQAALAREAGVKEEEVLMT